VPRSNPRIGIIALLRAGGFAQFLQHKGANVDEAACVVAHCGTSLSAARAGWLLIGNLRSRATM